MKTGLCRRARAAGRAGAAASLLGRRFEPRSNNDSQNYSLFSAHRSVSEAATRRRFGKCGLSVPAVTFHPSASIAFANCLASSSFGNAFVCLDEGARDEVGRHSLGASTETYQRFSLKRTSPIPQRIIRRGGNTTAGKGGASKRLSINRRYFDTRRVGEILIQIARRGPFSRRGVIASELALGERTASGPGSFRPAIERPTGARYAHPAFPGRQDCGRSGSATSRSMR